MKKKIWIDLDNSPHVLFFKPIIRELIQREFLILVTARDAFQVKDLLIQMNISADVVGHHNGKNSLLKLFGLFIRAWQLKPFVLKFKPDLALSHGSRAQSILSKLLGIRTMMFLDYEFVKLIPFFYPNYLITPEIVAAEKFISHGIKIMHYPGIKEDVYVPEFIPDLGAAGEKTNRDLILITIREPATEAHYFVPESEELFEFVMDHLSAFDNVMLTVLPRNSKRREYCKKRWRALINKNKMFLPDHAVDGLNLLWNSDLVISGGGTMNREAAALGVPVYSIFRGQLGAVDQYLAKEGRLTIIKDQLDCVNKIKVRKCQKDPHSLPKPKETLEKIIDLIETAI